MITYSINHGISNFDKGIVLISKLLIPYRIPIGYTGLLIKTIEFQRRGGFTVIPWNCIFF